jgi:hypothetical protein
VAKTDEIKIPDAEPETKPEIRTEPIVGVGPWGSTPPQIIGCYPPATDIETKRDADRRQLWCDVVRIWFTRNHNIENAIGHAGTALRYFDEKFPKE